MGIIRDIDHGWHRIMNLAHEPKRMVVIQVPATDPKHHQPYPLFVEYGHRVVTHAMKLREFVGPVQGEANTRFEGPTKGYVEPRPFMAWTWEAHDSYKAELQALAKFLWVRAGQDQAFGETATAELKKLGEKVVADVKGTIEGMGLIDTGRMYRSVRANVRIERPGESAALSSSATMGAGE